MRQLLNVLFSSSNCARKIGPFHSQMSFALSCIVVQLFDGDLKAPGECSGTCLHRRNQELLKSSSSTKDHSFADLRAFAHFSRSFTGNRSPSQERISYLGEAVREFRSRIRGNIGRSEAAQTSPKSKCWARAQGGIESSLEEDFQQSGLPRNERDRPRLRALDGA
jgi:hypothetical protein